jgi:hypothetical protein
MNDHVFIAKIKWLTEEQGGRKQGIPMKNEKYCPLVAVDGKREFLGGAFGLLCYSYEKIGENTTLAQIRFLNTEAAPDVLYIGANIDLYEGNKLVARGSVLAPSDFTFDLSN